MSDGKIWTDETTGLLVDVIGDALKPKVPFFLRGLVKPAVKIALNLCNKYLDKVIPDSIDSYINDAINKGYEGDWDGAATDVGLAADLLVDIPGVDDDHEKQLFISIAQAIVNGVKTWIETNKKGA